MKGQNSVRLFAFAAYDDLRLLSRGTPKHPTFPSWPGLEKASPKVPEIIKIEYEETTIAFAVSQTNQTKSKDLTPSNQRTYMLLKANQPVTTDQVMEMMGDIIDAFITREYYPWLRRHVENSGINVIKITCVATGNASTTQSTDVFEMT